MKLRSQRHVRGIFDKKGQLKTPHRLSDYKDNSGSIIFLSFKKQIQCTLNASYSKQPEYPPEPYFFIHSDGGKLTILNMQGVATRIIKSSEITDITDYTVLISLSKGVLHFNSF